MATKPKKQKWKEIRDILLQMKEDTLREITKSLKNGADTTLIGEPSAPQAGRESRQKERKDPPPRAKPVLAPVPENPPEDAPDEQKEPRENPAPAHRPACGWSAWRR